MSFLFYLFQLVCSYIVVSSLALFSVFTPQKPFPGRKWSQRGKARVHGDDSAAVWLEIGSSFLGEPGDSQYISS